MRSAALHPLLLSEVWGIAAFTLGLRLHMKLLIALVCCSKCGGAKHFFVSFFVVVVLF